MHSIENKWVDLEIVVLSNITTCLLDCEEFEALVPSVCVGRCEDVCATK